MLYNIALIYSVDNTNDKRDQKMKKWIWQKKADSVSAEWVSDAIVEFKLTAPMPGDLLSKGLRYGNTWQILKIL